MATVTPSKEPGFYLETGNVVFKFDTTVSKYSYSVNSVAPSVSEYIAYDTLTPPNPFIAVTQDGKGRVVYDGGFPKFYNGANASATPTFSGLTSAGKYLYNAIMWVKNETKYASGNRKLLILGDDFNGAPYYSIKSTGGDGFFNTLSTISQAAGFTPTFKNCSDYGGKVDIRLAELEQYALVLFFGCNDGSTAPSITTQSINDLVTYRENGNGLVVVTDHGEVLANINDATRTNQWGFFKIVNQVVARFGAYFSSDYDRVPVNVGFLRSNYGDHPLYNGLTNSENIPAGGSESRVFVSSSQTFTGDLTVPLPQGTTTINILTIGQDKSIQTFKYTYIVQGNEIIFMNSTDTRPDKTSSSQTSNTVVHALPNGNLCAFTVSIDPGDIGTMFGEILLNGKRVGDLMATSASNIEWALYAGSSFRVKAGDNLSVSIKSPIGYSKTIPILKSTVPNSIEYSSSIKNLSTVYGTSSLTNMELLTASVNSLLTKEILPAALVKKVTTAVNGLNPNTVNISNVRIYDTGALAISAFNSDSTKYNKCYIDGSTDTVYAYVSGSAQAIPGLKTSDIYPYPAIITSITGKVWRLSATGVLT